MTPARGHHCLYQQRGEKCPGDCSTVADERDGYRCPKCGRWAETVEGINHASAGCVPAPRGRR